MSIIVKDLSKKYQDQQALSSVSFTLAKGEITGLLGPNGAGKSTLMKILTTFLEADGGSGTVAGYDLMTQRREVQRRIGYLPEHNPLYLDLYVREYLGFHADIFGLGKSRIEEVIELTGLGPEARKKTGALSKGYRQRVGLAAAIIHDPEVLILDEPTTGLDPEQLIEIRNLIRQIGKDKTVLLSTHIMQEVEAVCDRVLMMKKGKLIADKTLSSLLEDQAQVIVVEFDYRVEEVLLQRLPHAQTVRNVHGFVYEVNFNTSSDMRPAIFDFAHDNQLKTLQLHRKNKSLESLFLELTREQ